MATTFVQTNSAANASAIAALCSGRSLNTDRESNQAAVGASAGSTPRTVTMNGSASVLAAIWLELGGSDGDIDAYDGASGTWTVPINHSTGNHQVTLEEVHICRVNSSYVNQATLGSTTGIGFNTNSGTASVNVTQGSSTTINAGDKIIIICVYSNANSMTQDFAYTPDQSITAPGTITVVAPDLSWHPVYPAIVREPPRLASEIQAGAYFAPAATLANSRMTGSLGGGNPQIREQLQHPAITGPVFIRREVRVTGQAGADNPQVREQMQYMALTAPVVTPVVVVAPDLSWHPTYPDEVRRPEDLGAERQTALFLEPFPHPAAPELSWHPVYPNIVRDAPHRTEQQPYFYAEPFPHAAAPELSWHPVYPDVVRPPLDIGAEQRQALFLEPFPHPAAPDLSWKPLYDDWLVPAPDIGTAQQRAFFLPEFPLPVTVDALGWRGVYPDIVRADALDTAQHQALWREPFPHAAAPDLSWEPSYPDEVRPPQPTPNVPAIFWSTLTPAVFDASLVPRVYYPDVVRAADLETAQHGALFLEPFPHAPAPELSWKPEYPDRLELPPALGVEQQWAFAINIEPIVVTTDALGWRGVYPDEIFTREQHADEMQALFREPFPHAPAPDLSWHPVYPDRIEEPRRLRPASQWFFAGPEFPLPVPVAELAWRGVYPDWVEPIEPPVQPEVVSPPILIVEVEQLGWRGVYPDWIDVAVLDVAAMPALFRPSFPQPPAPDLSWLGEWPSIVRERPVPADLPYLFWGVLTPAEALPPLSWAPIYPDQVRQLVPSHDPFLFFLAPSSDVICIGVRGGPRSGT